MISACISATSKKRCKQWMTVQNLFPLDLFSLTAKWTQKQLGNGVVREAFKIKNSRGMKIHVGSAQTTTLQTYLRNTDWLKARGVLSPFDLRTRPSRNLLDFSEIYLATTIIKFSLDNQITCFYTSEPYTVPLIFCDYIQK